MEQAINGNPSVSSTVPDNNPLKDQGIRVLSQTCYLRNNHSLIFQKPLNTISHWSHVIS